MYKELKGMKLIDQWESVLYESRLKSNALEYYAFEGIKFKVSYSMVFLKNKEASELGDAYIGRLEVIEQAIRQYENAL